MPRSRRWKSVAVVAVALFAWTAAQSSTTPDTGLVLPSGWKEVPTSSQNFKAVVTPDGRIRITVAETRVEQVGNVDMEQAAQRTLNAIVESQKKMAANAGAGVLSHLKDIKQAGRSWYIETAMDLSTGLKLRGLTILRPGQSIMIGAESRSAGQVELEDALRQFLQGPTKN